MTRRQKDPLRELTDQEREWLGRISHSHAEPAAHVARAKALLAVSNGDSYTEAAKPPDAAPVKPSLIWSLASTGRASAPSNHSTAVVLRPSTPRPSVSAILAEARRIPELANPMCRVYSVEEPGQLQGTVSGLFAITGMPPYDSRPSEAAYSPGARGPSPTDP